MNIGGSAAVTGLALTEPAESAKALQAEAEREASAWRERFTTAETVGVREWGVVAKALGLDPATFTAGDVVEAIEGLAKDADIARQWRAEVNKMRAGGLLEAHDPTPDYRAALAHAGRAIEAAGKALAAINGGDHE